MSRVLRTGENKITNGYAGHTGWSKGVDVVKKLENGTYTIDDVTAHSDGTVIKVVDYMTGTNGKLDRESMGYGCYVMVLHNNKYRNKYVVTLYAHLAKVDGKIKEGATVTQGQVLGVIGNTGRSFGAHLHHEVRLFDTEPVYTALHNTALFEWIDPTPYLDTDLPTDVVGFLDTVYSDATGVGCTGWAYKNGGGQKVDIRFYKADELIKTLTVIANLPRVDVEKAMGYNTDKVGFEMCKGVVDAGEYIVKAFVDDVQLTNEKKLTVKSILTAKSYADYPNEENKYYRIRKSFNDAKSSKGSYRKFAGAFTTWKSYSAYGYHIYDNDGKQLD